MENVARKTCGPCKHGSPPAKELEIKQFLKEHPDWEYVADDSVKKLKRAFVFSNYKKALHFTNQVADMAEFEDHHPAILLEWGKVTVYWWTHKIGGIHRNDLLMATETDTKYSKKNPERYPSGHWMVM